MLKASLFNRQGRSFLLLLVCLLVMSVLPPYQANAATKLLALDNQLTDFTRGKFQRSSLSALQGSFDSQDLPGAVQLLPVGQLKNWEKTGFNLPKKLTDIGAVTIGKHMFVIGGLLGDNSLRQPTAEVWSATINPATGALVQVGNDYWVAEKALPAVEAAVDALGGGAYTLAPRSVPAVASVATGPDSGFIYVLGGSVQPNQTTTLSSYGVNIATVVSGHITSWAAGTKLPDPTGLNSPLGLQSASAVSFTRNGKTFIYLIGGLQRFLNGSSYQELGSHSVYYAQVNSDGSLSKPNGSSGSDTVWGTLSPITLPSSVDTSVGGVWDAAVIADHFDPGGDGLYVMGGQLQSNVGNGQLANVYSNLVFRAVIQSDGTLAWQQDSPEPTLPEGRIGLSGIEYNGAIYLTGGKPAGSSVGEAESAVLSTYVEDDLKLAQIGQSSSSFVKSPDTLTVPRSRHATVVIPATPSNQFPNPAYVYVIAGAGDSKDQDTSDDYGSDTVIIGKIGTSEDTKNTSFAPSGWYYSQVHSTVFTGAQVQEILWSTVISRPADIQLEYRISVDNSCSTPTNLNTAAWQPLDGSTGDGYFSLNGFNKVTLGTPPAANCFQYRAKLVNGASGLTTTPALLNFNIRVLVPGNPDLRVQRLTPLQDADKHLLELVTVIENRSDNPPTRPANIDGGGTFYVDLFVFGPGSTVVQPTIPVQPGSAGDVACIEISKNAMPADTQFNITQWYDAGTCKQPKNVLSLFPTGGKYTVFVVVDSYCNIGTSYQCVDEGTTGETNNITKVEFTLPDSPVRYPMRLPIISTK